MVELPVNNRTLKILGDREDKVMVQCSQSVADHPKDPADAVFLQGESALADFAVSVFDAPVSNTTPHKTASWPEVRRMLQEDIAVLPDNKPDTKARHGQYFVRGVITGERNDANLTDCCLLILDVDKPLPGKELPTVYEIHDTLGDIPHAVYTSVTPGRSRIVVPVASYQKEQTSTLTRQLYDFCRSLGLEFSYAGESKTASQPWFYGQTLDKNSFVCLVNNEGDLFTADPDYVEEAPTQTKTGDPETNASRNHLADFLDALKNGTIHEAVKRYAGWQSRTTNLTMWQIFDDTTVLIESHCSDRDKVARWHESERAGLEAWFKKNAGQDTPKNATPRPLPDELLPVAPFDYALLPASLRDWCKDISERMQCPPDFVAVGLMTALGSVLGRRIGIRPQAQTDWTEVCNIWGLIVGRPGLLKTPALDAAMGPINRLIAQALKEYQEQTDVFEKTVESEQLRAAARKKQAAGRLKENPDADLSDLQPPTIEPPALKRYKSNDPSPAALAELLRHAPNGLMVFRDEMVSLLKSLDRDDNSEGRGFFLTAWGGNSPFTSDRIGRGFNLHIPAVCLSLLGGTQPGKLGAYVRQAVSGGSGDDGLLQRFSMTVWPDTNHTWLNIDRPTNRTAKNAAYEVFDRLDKLDPSEVLAEQDVDFCGEPEGIPYLRFSPEALELFVEWRAELENEKLRGSDHPAIISHLAKYRKLVPSLALLIHLADGGKGPVAVHPTMQALAWADYLETHARRVYGAVSQPEVAAAKAILSRIKRGDLSENFKARDVYRRGWTGLSDQRSVVDALALLVDYDWLVEEQEQTGGRPTMVYRSVKEVTP